MLFEKVSDLDAGAEQLRRRRYGVIEVDDSGLRSIRLRPIPKLVTPECLLLGRWYHRRRRGNACWLYYNQPIGCPNFLALKYVVSTSDCQLATVFEALRVLDEIARIKQTDAIVCDAANFRISDRLLARQGWEAHCPSRWHRNYIKRFYGTYPAALLATS